MECFVYQKTMELLCAQSIAWGMHWDVFVGLPQRRSQCIQECWSAPVQQVWIGSGWNWFCAVKNVCVCIARCRGISIHSPSRSCLSQTSSYTKPESVRIRLSSLYHLPLCFIIQDSHCNLISIGSIVSCGQKSRCTICLRDSALYHHHWVTLSV